MAVTKIRRISSWTLLASVIISVVVLGLFFTGGVVDPAAEMKEPVNTPLLLQWVYVLFGVTIVGTVGFGLFQFFENIKTNVKGALLSVAVFAAFAAIMFIAYSLGDGTPIQGMNVDAQAFNVESWLRITDMWIYTIYTMIGLILLAVIFGSIKKILNK